MTRAMLLPMPRATADELALQVHIALDAMRRGRGTVHAAQTLTQTMVLVGFLFDLGYGEVTAAQLRLADHDISAAFDLGRATGEWRLDGEAADRFARLVATYDLQLQCAPLWAVAEASDRLDRFRAGEPFEGIARKRA